MSSRRRLYGLRLFLVYYAHMRMAEYEYRSRCGGCLAVGIVMM